MTDEPNNDDPTPAADSRTDSVNRPRSDLPAQQPAQPSSDWQAMSEAHAASGRRSRTHVLSGEDLALPGRRVKLPLILFLATCVTTFWAGCKGWIPAFIFLDFGLVQKLVAEGWDRGLIYMLAVMAILLAHEMGHFVQTVRYHIPASWPFFIPIVGVPTGTMGAVIGLDGSRANRKEMFDMGISGPLAGLVIAVPMGMYAISNMVPDMREGGGIVFNDPLLFQMMVSWAHPNLPVDQALTGSSFTVALYMAAWVGMLITGLNMLPIGQLDGGHVAYCLFGQRAHALARGLLLFSIAYMIISGNDSWILMVVLVIFIGTDHPPTHDDTVPMGPVRYAIGIASLLIPVLCFMPTPISMR